MFSGVAGRYDLLNRVLSVRQDVRWRRRLVAALDAAPPGPVLDLATGTGDVALAVDGRETIGADFCVDMLALARGKAERRRRHLALAGADALALPFQDGVFAAVTVAFGVRNFADLDAGFAEVARVLRGGGIFAVLEFQRPASPLVAAFSAAWNRLVVTPVGRLVSHDGEAYAYLPASVTTFPDHHELATRIERHGFSGVASETLSGGIAALTVARKVGGR